ncbi:MAG TPA: hypothetical protein VGF73_08000 [Chthoniobacterales bacterium]
MKYRLCFFRSYLFFFALAFLGLAGTTCASSRGWIVYDSPNLGETNFLAGVSALSASDAWTVGYAYDASSLQITMAQHWDGAQWNTVSTPNPGTAQACGDPSFAGSELAGVDAISSSDVWAVGEICQPGIGKTLALHWDGSGWSAIPSPNKGINEDSELASVVAIAPNDVWAVGNYQEAFQYVWETLVEHWDGTSWKIVESPNPSDSEATYLTAVSGVASDDIWAVGYSQDGVKPLIEHWDGMAWSIVNAPYPAMSDFNGLYGVKAIAPNDAWAVGYQNSNSSGQNGQGLILHWDGATWSQIESPIAGYATILLGVGAGSSTDVNAVGYVQTRNVQFQPVTEHWNGTRWTVVKVAIPGRVGQLYGTDSADGSTWAVGAYSLLPMTQGYMQNPSTLILKNR